MKTDKTERKFEWTPLVVDERDVATFLMVSGFKQHHYFILRKHVEYEWVAYVQDGDKMTQLAYVVGRYNDLETAKSMLVQEWKERHKPEPEPVIRWGWVSDSVRAIAKLYVNERLTDYNVVRRHVDKGWTARNDLEHIADSTDVEKCLEVAENAWRKEIRS